MHRHRTHRFLAGVAVAILAVSLSAAVARADAGEEAPAAEADKPNTGALTLTFDNSFTTSYMFRGIQNQRDGLIWQPSLELSLNLFGSEEGLVRSVDLGMGIWASYQTKNYAMTPGTDGLYETDYYPSLSVSWAGGVTTALTFYDYTSPNDTFRDVEEVAVDLSYDDSELLGDFAVSPTATFAFETHNTSFGSGKGAVLELGIEPGHEFAVTDKTSIGITVPVKLGLSLDDYYDDGVTSDAFGYAVIGLHASVPIGCIPARYGAWSVTNGFDVYFLNDALEAANQGDAVYPVWTSSVTLDY